MTLNEPWRSGQGPTRTLTRPSRTLQPLQKCGRPESQRSCSQAQGDSRISRFDPPAVQVGGTRGHTVGVGCSSIRAVSRCHFVRPDQLCFESNNGHCITYLSGVGLAGAHAEARCQGADVLHVVPLVRSAFFRTSSRENCYSLRW
jgi:hypothetical protein